MSEWKKLDDVLTYILSSPRPINSNSIAMHFKNTTPVINSEEIKILLNKLESDQYITFSSVNFGVSLTLEGKILIQNGGYVALTTKTKRKEKKESRSRLLSQVGSVFAIIGALSTITFAILNYQKGVEVDKLKRQLEECASKKK